MSSANQNTEIQNKIKVSMAQGQEVEFHEIKIQLFQEVEFSIMRSKFLIMNFCKIDQEIELALGALRELG
jgi:hypothetical protein